MSKSRRGSRRRFVSTAAAVAAAVASVASNLAQGATYYWDTTTTGTWATGNNWANNAGAGGTIGVVPLATDSVLFNQTSVNGAETVQLNATTSITGLAFQNTGTTAITSSSTTTQVLNLGAGGILVNGFQGSAGSGTGAVTVGNATNQINLVLSGAQSWNNFSANTLTIAATTNNSGNNIAVSGIGATTISGAISGTGALTIGGVLPVSTSAVTLSGANTYSGTTTLSSGGYLNFNNASAIGTGTFVIGTNSTLDNSSAAGITNTGNNAITLNGNFAYVGTRTLNLGTGTVTLGATSTITNNSANALTFGGAISGSFGFGVSGTGAGGVVLSGVSAYTGNTTVGIGSNLGLTFTATNTTNLLPSTTTLILNGGTLTLTGTTGATDSQSVTGVTLNSGQSNIVFSQGGATSLNATLNTITRTGGIGGVLNVSLPTSGTVNVSNGIDASGIIGPWAIAGTAAAQTGYLTVTGGALAAYTGATAMPTTGGSGTANYTLGAASTLTGALASETIQYTGAAGTLANGGFGLTINGLLNTGTGLLTISGTGAIAVGTISNDFVVAGAQGVTISSVISGTGKGVTYSGANTLTLGAANTYTGATTVNSGTVTLGVANAVASTSTIVVNGGTLGLSTFNQSVGAVTINNGTISSTTGTLTSTGITATGGTISAIIAGATPITVNAGYPVTFSGVNTSTGAITVNSGGILKMGVASAFTTQAVTVASGGSLDINSFKTFSTGVLTISGAGAPGQYGAYENTSATDQINGVQALVLAGNATIGGAGRLDIRQNTAAPTWNMGGFTATINMVPSKYFSLVAATVSNPGNIVVASGGFSMETTTTLAGSATNTITVNNGAHLSYFQFAGTDAWTHIMQGGSKISTNSGTATTNTISGPFTLNGLVYVAPTTGVADVLALSGTISGAGGFNLQQGTLTLSGAGNTFSGGLFVPAGTLNLSSAGASGTSSVFLSGGTVNVTAASAVGNNAFANSITQTGGTLNISTTANAVTNNTALNLSGGTTNITVALNNTGGVNISGLNTTNVSVAGGLNGSVSVTGGTLNSQVIASGSYANNGSINVGGGTLASGIAGGNFQNVTLASGGLANPGGVGIVATGPLTLNNVNLASGSTLQFDIQSVSSYDQLSLLGSINIASGININFNNGNPIVAGAYKLIAYTGSVPSTGNFLLPTAPTNLTYSLSTSTDPGFIDLIVSGTFAGGNTSNWLRTASGSFSWNSAANWSGGIIPSSTGDTANFNSVLTAAETVTVDGQMHVGTLTLSPAAAFAYTIAQGTAGSTIYLDNGTSAASLSNTAQNNTITAPINLVSSNTNVNVASGTTLTLSGAVSGSGKLTLASGTGTVVLSGSNSYTGGTEIDSGTITINGTFGTNPTPLNNQGLGTTILNGGTLNFSNATGTTLNPTQGFAIVVGANGGTLNTGGATSGTGGKLNVVNMAGFFSGSGTLTKTGGGDLQVGGPSIGFTGNLILSNNGLIEDQNVGALGFGTTAGFNGGSITINGPVGTNAPELVISGIQIFNPVTLAGGTLSANGSNNAFLNNTVTVTASSTLRASQFQGQTVAQNFAIKTLTGTGALAVNGSTTANAIGMVTIGDATGYTGAITVGANAAIGLNSGTSALGGSIVAFTNVTSGIGLIGDGDGTSTPQTLSYAVPSQVTAAVFGTGNTTGYIVGKSGVTTQFNQAANKIIAPTTALPFTNAAANTLNVQPLNGFGLLLGNQAALTATSTFGVGTVVSVGQVAPAAQPSNLIPGLTLTNLTGAFNITKTGVGTLQLGINAADASNTFGAGAAASINVTAGIVSAIADGNLGASTNGITLNNTTLAEFLALQSFSTSRTITLGAATGSTIGVAGGQSLTLNSGLAYGAAANTLTKVENGTLILTTAATGGPTSATTINAGALQISASNQLGSGAITIANNISAALQLTGGATFTQAATINSSGIQNRGAIENVSGANIFNGAITVGTTFGVVAGNDDSSNTLTLGGAINGAANAMTFTGASGSRIKVTGVVSGTGSNIVFVSPSGGPFTTEFTGVNTFSGNLLSAYNTTVLIDGGGTFASVGTLATRFGSTVTLDNTLNNVNNRLGSGVMTLGGGAGNGGGATYNILGNSGASTAEVLKTVNAIGQTTINLVPAGQPVNLTLTATGGAFTHNAGTSVLLSGTNVLQSVGASGTGSSSFNTGSITTAASFQGAGTAGSTANQGVIPWMVLTDTNTGAYSLPTSTATALAGAGFLRALNASEATGGFVNTFNYNNQAFGGTPTIAGTWASASNVITTTNTAGLFVGEAVTAALGSGLPGNAFITAINPGVSITINANTTGAQTTATGLGFSTAGTNLNVTSAIPGPNSTLAPAINSLTLGAGGSVTLNNSNQVLTFGSNALGGAILATDTSGANSITGGQLGNGNQELIFHTPTGVTLTVGSNITGSGQVTKGESGTVALSGTSFGSGQINVLGGTLQLAGGNNTLAFPVLVNVNSGATLDLNGNNQIVQDFAFDNTTGVTGQGAIGSNGTVTSSGGILTLKRDNTARQMTGTLAGGMGVVISGQNTIILTQSQTYTGPTLINMAGGTVSLQNLGALSGTSSLTINRSTLAFDNQGGALDSSSRISSTLPITLGGGTLSLIGRQQTASAQTVGAVTAAEGSNTINSTVQTTGVAGSALTLTSLTRNVGATVNFTNTNGTLGTIGTNPTILISSAPTLPNNLIGGGFTVNGNDFASYNPTYGVGALGTAGFGGYSPLLLNNASPTDNVSMGIGTGVAIGSTTVNSFRSTGTVNVIQTPGTTLTLASGGLLAGGGAMSIGMSLNSATGAFTNTINQGNVTSGGQELFLLGGTNSTINSAITGSGMALVKSGSNTWTINGTNTYTGGTYVAQGTLTLGNGGNVTTGQSTLGTGGIFLTGGNLTQTAGGIIPAQAVTISGSSTLTTTSDLGVANTVSTLGSNVLTVTSTSGIHVGDFVSGTGIPGNEFVTAVNPANNTVTVSTSSGVTSGTNTITFRNLANAISTLTFNNNGGSSPTVSNTGILNITSGNITASSNNVGGVSTASVNTITGGNIDLGNVAIPTITVNPISFNGQNLAPFQPTLAIASAIQNSNNAVRVTGGGNLQLSGASTFTGGVNVASGTALTIAASSTNAGNGQPLSGPLGTGTLTLAGNNTLYSTGAFTVGNNVAIQGNISFDAPSAAAASVALGAGSQTISLPASTATTINVNAPNMTGILNASVTGANASIIKTGLGTLQLTNNLGASSTFSGGVFLNAGTLVATGVGTAGSSLGTGPVTISGGVLSLKHSGNASNGAILYGNNVQINTALGNAYINIDNNGANTGNSIIMGTLDYGTVAGTTFTSTVAGNAAPGTILNITGTQANAYRLQFNGTTLTNATSSPTFNVGAGLFLILPGGFTAGTNLPVNIGPGTLSYSGSNSGVVATSPITGTVAVSPAANSSSTPLGTGNITLNSGSTLQISPIMGNLTTAGYTTGGGTAKYYNTGATNTLGAANYGIAPNSTLSGIALNDSNLRMSPFGVNNNGAASNTVINYQAMLNITTGGTYFFGTGDDDNIQITVDGQTLQTRNGAGQALNQEPLLPINLTSGVHTISYRLANSGGGGGSYLLYSGPDTVANGLTGTPPTSNLQVLPATALSYATSWTAANNYQNAAILNNPITVAALGSATIDGLGTDFNYAIPSLTLPGGSTLNVANGTGTAFGSAGNGVFVVTGLTTLSGAINTISTSTGTIVLAGGVSDSGVGLNKTGPGNLILGNPGTGSFTGPLNINGGFVQLQDGAALTSGTTTIGVATTTPATLDLNGQTLSQAATLVLNGGAGPAAKTSNSPAGLYNSSPATASFAAGSTLSVGAATTAVNASIGGFGAIDLTNVTITGAAANGLDKVGPDTLILGNSNSFAGAFNIKGGIVQITGANGVSTDTTNAVVVSAGATLDLNAQSVSVAKPLTLNGTGMTGLALPNRLGALVSTGSGAVTYAGNITLGSNSSIGGPSLVGGVSGDITLPGTIAGAFQITKVGANNLFLTGASSATTQFDLQSGTLTAGGGVRLSATASGFVRQGTTLTLDNSGTATSNRLGTSTGDLGLWLSGNLVINGNSSTAVSEIINTAPNNIALGTTFANGYGGSTITLNTAGTAGVTLQVASTSTSIFARAAGNTSLIRGDNLGGTPGSSTATIVGNATSLGSSTNNGQSTGQTGAWAAANTLIYPWAVVDTSATGLGVSFAGYNGNTNGIAPISGTNGSTANFVASAPTLSAITGNVTNASAAVTVTNASGVSAGMVVTGAGIAANTTVLSVAGNTVTLSANATATSNTQLLFQSAVTGNVTVPNVVSTGNVTLSTVAAAQAINSLTLSNSGGSSTVTINTGGLQIDSGGILGVGTDVDTTTYAINGSSYLTGTNTLNRELIFHTVGIGTTMTVNAPIFVNGGGLTKADGGTLVLASAEKYLGDTVINGGRLQLAGGQNTIFRPLTTSATPGNTAAGATGQTLTVDFGGTLDLNGTIQAVGNFRSGSSTQLAGGTIINGNASPATLAVALNANQTWAGNISNGQSVGTITGNTIGLTGSATGGTLNFVRDGNNTLTINSPQTLGGSVTLLGGATTLVDLGTFQNASSLTVTRSTLIWNDQGVQAVSNRLGATAPITLNGGGIQFLTRAGSGANAAVGISLGTVNLGAGASNIMVSNIGQGGAFSLTLAGIGTRAPGSTLNFGNGTYAAGYNPNYLLTSAPTVTNGILPAWMTVTGLISSTGGANLGFATYDPAVGVRIVQYQPTATYGAGVNAGITGSTTIPTPLGTPTITTVNSLSIYNASTLSFTNTADTLLIQSGGLLAGNDSNAHVVGSTTTPGNIQSGAGNDLYVYSGTNTLTINSKIVDNGSNNNVIISSAAGATLTPVVALTNANTYGGTTYVSGVSVNLNSLLGSAIPHDVVLSGANAGTADSLAFNQTSLNWQQPNQLASNANITMNGATQLNLGNAANVPSQSVPNTQTINNLTINNDGGSNGANGPTIFTGAGTLTIAGQLTSTNNAETFSIPTINGFVALTNAAPVIQVDANLYSPSQLGLAINANIATTASTITKSGTGWLGIGGQSSNLVGTTMNVTGGGLAFSPSTGTSNAVLGSAVVLSANTTFDTRATSGVLGSLASASTSAVLMNGVQGTGATLTTGLDNTSGTFAGTISSPYPTGLLSVTKIGTGAWTLTNNSQATASGTMTVSGGSVAVTSGGGLNFQTTTLNTGGTLLLNNSATASSNRLGTAFFTTANTLLPTVRTLNLQGGNLTVTGNGGTVVSEGLGGVGITGGGILTLDATSSAGVNATLQSIGGQGAQTSLLIRGSGLGTAAGGNVATLQFANTGGAILTPPGVGFPGQAGQGGGNNNTTTKTVRPDIIVDSTANGLGQGFMTIDSATGLVRPLGFGAGVTNASELAGTWTSATSATTNVQLAAGTTAFGSSTANALSAGQFSSNLTANTLTLQSGSGVNLAVVPTNSWGANGGLLTVTPNADGVLSVAGSNTITAGQVSTGGVTSDWHVLTGSTLTVNALVNGSTGGLVKAGGGTLVFNQPVVTNTSLVIAINGGTIKLGSGLAANPLFYYPAGSGAPGAEGLAVNNGTLDINGVTTALGTLTTTNSLPFAGGTSGSPNSVITNTSATVATLITNNTSTTLGTVFSGNLNLDKAGNTTMQLSSPQTYTGTTTIRGGSLVLRDQATLASNNITTNFSELTLDNTGLANVNQRISSSATLNLSGGALRVNASSLQTTQNIGTVAMTGGSNLFYIAQYSNNGNASAPTFNIGNLATSNASTLLIEAPYNGALGNFANANAHVYVSNINGVPFNASSMVNGIIGPQYVVANTGNTFNWATYSNIAGVTIPNSNGTPNYANTANNNGSLTTVGAGGISDNIAIVSGSGVGTGADTSGSTTITVTSTTGIGVGSLVTGTGIPANTVVTAVTNGTTLTISQAATSSNTGQTFTFGANTLGATGRTVNSLAILAPGAATVLGMNTPADQLVLGSGGLLINDNGNRGVTIAGGSLTSGSSNTASTLYLHNYVTTTAAVINSPIVNNGSGAVTLSRVGNGLLAINPQVLEPVLVPATASSTLTVPSSTGLSVGMTVTGTNITAGTTITSIAGNTVSLSTATTAGTAGTSMLTFGPATTSATSGTTAGTNTVTIAAAAVNANFLPTVGQAIGGPNIPGGTTITGVSGTAGGALTLTLSQNAIATGSTAVLSVGAISNTYSGGTVISAGVDQYAGGTTNLTGSPGSIAIPGNLTINGGATVTMVTNQGQIAPTSNLTINGSGTLNYVGTNTASSITFNNSGGNANPTLNAATLLNLSSATPITATNDNTGFTPQISGTTINFANAGGATINVSGQSLNGLNISAAITSAGTITKTGSGSLILSSGSNGSLTWALNGGYIYVNATNALGTNTAAAGALSFNGNVGLASANNVGNTINLQTIFSGPTTLNLGLVHANNQVTLSGAMNLNNQNPTFNVTAAQTTDTISGVISGAGGFNKTGPGALSLTVANTLTGPISVTGGLLKQGIANAFGSANTGADYTVRTAGEIDINNIALQIGSLSDGGTAGGIVTNSGGTAGTLLTIGAGSNATNATFAGTLVAATPANLALTKTGTNNQTLSGQSYFTGATTVSGGTLTLRNGSALATTPTLANTTVSVASGATLAIRADGSNVGTANTVTIGNATTANAGGSLTLAAGGILDLRDTTINTLKIDGAGTGTALTSAATASLNFDIGSTGADTISLTRVASITGGTINLNALTGATSLPIGVVPLITSTAAGTFAGTGTNNFTLGTTSLTVGTKTYSFTLAGTQNTTTQTALNVSVSTTAAYWSGAVDGNWSTGAATGVTNWRTDATSNIDTQTPPSAVTDVVFSTTTPAPANLSTTTTGAAIAMNSLTFSSASNVTITDGGIAANNLTIGIGGLTLQPTSGSASINSNVVLSAAQTWTNDSSKTLTVTGTTGGGSITSTNTNLTVGGSGSTAISASLDLGSGSLTKTGTGRVALAGASTYTGGTTVSAGLLLANNTGGSATGTNAVTVSGGTFGGYGSITGALSITSGSVSPGDPLGNPNNALKTTAILNVGGLSLTGAGSSLTSKINAAPASTPTATAGNDWSAVNVTGAVALSGTVNDLPSVVGSVVTGGPNLNLNLGSLFQTTTATAGDKVSLIINDGNDSIAGFFSTVGGSGLLAVSVNDPNPSAPTMFDGTDPVTGFKFTLNYAANLDIGAVGNDLSLTFTQVPEPGSFGLLGAAAVGLLARRRRRRA